MLFGKDVQGQCRNIICVQDICNFVPFSFEQSRRKKRSASELHFKSESGK